MTFKLRPKALFEFLRWLPRKSKPDMRQFSLAVRDVITARMLLAMTGDLSAAEALRMVEEKRWAAVRAKLAYSEAILKGEATSAPAAYFDVYQRVVESNRKRLSNPRWRWLKLYYSR